MMSSPTSKKYDPFIILIISIIAIIPAWMNYDIIARDGAYLYIPFAKYFNGHTFSDAISSFYAKSSPLPIYEYCVYLIVKISDFSFETSGRLCSAIFFVLGSLTLYYLTLVIFKNRLAGFIAILFYISNRLLLNNSVDCLKESLFVFIILLGNLYVLKSAVDRGSLIYLIIGIIILLIGSGIRATSIIFLAAWLITWILYGGNKVLIKLGVCSLSVLVFITFILYFKDNSVIKDLDITTIVDSAYKYSNFKLNLDHLYDFQVAFFKRSYYLIGTIGLIGIIFIRKNIYTLHMAVTILLFVIIIVVYPLKEFSDRYVLALIMYLIPMSSFAVINMLKSKRTVLRFIAIVTILLCPFLWATKSFAKPDPDYLAQKEAGKWILSIIGPGRNIVTNEERILFYAEAEPLFIYSNPLPDNVENFKAYWPMTLREIGIYRVVKDRKLLMPLAIDVSEDDGKIWLKYLSDNGLNSDKVFRSIFIYIPDKLKNQIK